MPERQAFLHLPFATHHEDGIDYENPKLRPFRKLLHQFLTTMVAVTMPAAF